MMTTKYKIVKTSRFRRDLRLAIRKKFNIHLMDEIITTLANGKKLARKHNDHPLSGEYAGYRECHITPDWLLIYRIENDTLCLVLSRTGSHSDLF